MSMLEKVGGWLIPNDLMEPVDALVVLDGAEFSLRLAAGVDLLRRGFAPRLVVIESRYHRAQHAPARQAARDRPHQVFLLPCSAASTAQEAEAVWPVLQAWKCASVMVVTSWYHTRRARKIFARRLCRSGVRVSTYPVAVPGVSRRSWWRSSWGRRTLALEYAKWLATGLHLDLPGARELRWRVKEWLLPTMAAHAPGNAKRGVRKVA